MPFNDSQLAFLKSIDGERDATPVAPTALDYGKERNLRQIAMMTPEEQAESERIEAGAGAQEELVRELARVRDPQARAALLEEAVRRGMAVPEAVTPMVRTVQVGGVRPRVVAPVRSAGDDPYANYAEQARARAAVGDNELLAAAIDGERQAKRKAALEKGPGLGDYAKAAGASLVQGIGDIAQGIVGEPLAFLANSLSGGEDYVGFNPLKPAAEAIRGSMSEAGQAARQDQPKGNLFEPESWTMPERATSLLMLGAEGFGSLIPSMLPAIGLASRVQKAGQAVAVAEKAGNAAKLAAAQQELAAAQRLSMLASGATAGGMTAGAAAGDVRERVAKQVGTMSHEDLLAVPLYAKAFAATGDAGAAKQAVINGAAQYAGVLSGLAGAAGGATTSKLIDDILVKQGMAKVLGKVSGNAGVRAGVAGAGGATAEGLQEVSEQLGQNVGENLALGKPVGEDAGRDTFGAFVGGAMVGAPVGGVGGAMSEVPPVPAVKPRANSPLSNASAAGNPATAQAFAQAKAEEDRAAFPDAELNEMRAKVGAWLEDRNNIQMLRQRDPAMVGEAFHVWNNVINNPEVALRTRISALEQAVSLIDGLPNFTMPGSGAGNPPAPPTGGAVVPAGPGGGGLGPVRPGPAPDPAAGSIPGEATRISGALTGQPGGDRARKLAYDDGSRARAAAEYEAAFQDLVKAEQLGAADAELMQKQQAARDAEVRLQEIDAAIAANRAQATASKREALLDAVLGDLPDGQNPARAFGRALAEAGFNDLDFSDAERAKIGRWLELKATLEQPLEQAPAAPNELDAGALGVRARDERAAPVAADPGRKRFRFEQIKDLVSKGFTQLDGTDLVNAKTGHREPLKGKAELQVARQALRAALDKAAHAAATSPSNDLAEPTAAQKEAGNYRKGHIVDFHGFAIAIENPDGSVRRGVSPDGTPWESVMHGHYGYFKGIIGFDKDHLDINIGPRPDLTTFYVIDQIDPASGRFDEHKVYAGYASIAAAEAAYRSNYQAGWDGLQAIHSATLDEFRAWVDERGPKNGRFADWLAARDEAAKPEIDAAPAVVTGPAVDEAPKGRLAEDEQRLLQKFPVGTRVIVSKSRLNEGENIDGRVGTVAKGHFDGWYVNLDRNPRERSDKQVLILQSDSIERLPERVSGYKLPDDAKQMARWNALKNGRETPDAHEKRMISAVEQALAAGLFYNTDVAKSVRETLGDYVPDQFWSIKNGVEGGPMGMEIYYARQVVEQRQKDAAVKAAAEALDLTPGKKLGVLIFNDFKRTVATMVKEAPDDGYGVVLTGTRGSNKVELRTDALSIQGAIARAVEKGARAAERSPAPTDAGTAAVEAATEAAPAGGDDAIVEEKPAESQPAAWVVLSWNNGDQIESRRVPAMAVFKMPEEAGEAVFAVHNVLKNDLPGGYDPAGFTVSELTTGLTVGVEAGDARTAVEMARDKLQKVGRARFDSALRGAKVITPPARVPAVTGLPWEQAADQDTIKKADQPGAETVTAPEQSEASPVSQQKTDATPKAAPDKASASDLDAMFDEVLAEETAKDAVPAGGGVSVKDLALQEQKAAGWNPDWPFVPADLGNADFRALIASDEGISQQEKDQIFAAGRRLGVVPANAPASGEALANATAPEHVALGVDDRELGEIVAEFREFQQAMIEPDGEKITHVFDAPEKDEVVRLADKAKVYHKDHGWMTPEQAKARIAEWKAHAAAQYDDPAIRDANSQKVVLSLFDLTGKWSQPWEDAGYQVYRFDIQADPEVGDVNKFSTDFFNDWFGDFDGMDIHAVLAACPCTDFASSGARHFAAKDADGRTVASVKLVHQTLKVIEYFKPAVWAVENPVGRIEKLGGLPPWRLAFDPNHVGEDYTKKTLIWGRFNADLPIAPTEATEGSKMHRLYGGKSMATKNARSATPEGFAYSFFMANNAHDHPAMALANKFDRLDRKLIERAIAAGVAPEEIERAVEDFYYMDLDDDAANEAIRDLLPDGTGGDEPTGKKEAAPAADTAPAIEAPKGWQKNYGAAAKYAEALGIALRGDDKKFKKVPVLVAEIEAKLEAPSPAPEDAPTAGEGYDPVARIRSVLAKAEEQLATLQRQQKDAEKTGNAWVYVDKIAAAERNVAAYREALDKIGGANPEGGSSQFANSEPQTVEAVSLNDLIGKVDAGYRVHYDYAGADGTTIWIEQTDKGWVLKEKADDSTVTFTKGAAGAGSWDKLNALNAAEARARYRFTEWKPLVEEKAADAPSVEDISSGRALVDRVQRKIGEWVANATNGGARAMDRNWERVAVKRFAQQNIDPHLQGKQLGSRAAAKIAVAKSDSFAELSAAIEKFVLTDTAPEKVGDVDLGALFDEVLAEETAPAKNIERVKAKRAAREAKPAPSEAVKKAAAGLVIVPGGADGTPYVVRDPRDNGGSGVTLASFQVSEQGRPVQIKHYYSHTQDYTQLAIDQWAAQNKSVAKPVTPQVPSGGMEKYITVAADSIQQLRKVDVYRVLVESNRVENRLAIAAYIKANRPDLAAEVDSVLADNPPETTRSAGAAAGSAVKNVAGGLADAIAGLGALFGGNGRLSSGLTFDEETYAKAKPLFKQAIAHFTAAGGDIREAMRAVVRMILDQFGKPAAENMKPYVVRFMADVQSGNLDYDEGKEAQDGNGQSDDGRDGAGSAGDPALGPVAAPEDGGPEGSGNAGDAGEPGGRTGAGRNRRAGGAGGRSRSGRGNGAAGIRDTAAGARGGVSPNEAPAGIPAQNFVITEDVRLGQGGEVAKFNDNLAAIRLLKRLEAEKRRATPDEQRTLARYVGWGGLPNAFADKTTGEFKKGWETRGPELAALLTADELAAARRSTMDAHYTAQPVVQAMWAAAERLGFRGGMVLEPSMGTGNFFGLIPNHLGGSTRMVGVEYDSLTARIAKALYPQSSVLHGGFQDVPLPADTFDLAIGNPPFGGQSLYFPYNDKANGLSIHNQFFVGSMDAVRPGGLQIMVVSRYLMDAKDDTARKLLAEQAELVGAVRLPDSAFQENARTEVVTDILFLKKRSAADQEYFKEALKDPDLRAEWPSWIETRDLPDPLGGEAMTVNRYFAENPDKVLGVLERSGSMRYGADVTVRAPEGQDLRAAIAAAVDSLPAGVPNSDAAVAASVAQFEAMREGLELVMEGREEGAIYVAEDGALLQVMSREAPNGRDQLARRTLSPMAPWSPQLMMDAEGRWFRVTPKVDAQGNKVKNGRFVVYDRETFASEADVPETLRLGAARFERLQALIGLRDLLKKQIVLETSDGAGIEENRQALAKAYEAYVATHGFVGADLSQALLAGMPDGALVTALELKYDAGVSAAKAKKLGERMRKPSAVPAPILKQRVMVPYVAPESANSAEDALFITLAERGRVDLERMAALLKSDEAAVIAALHENLETPLIFRDPETERWETRDAYLSGQVLKKLNAARAAGLDKNVAALEKVQPEPIPASEIGVRLGSVWVPGDIYGDFVAEVTGAPATVRFNKLMNLFDVSGNRDTVKSKTEFGTSRMNALDILEDLLNSRAVTVYDTYTDENGNKKRTLNEEATTEANAKADEIHNLFADWIMADGDRRKRLAAIYNEQFNNRVIRQYDGSQLTLPGKVPDQIITLRRHQKNAVWRGIVERFMLFDHTVGAGKTFTAIARNMERRRMGLSRKPMIVVPNHMVEQFAADVYRLYPGARVLAAGKADFEAKKRRRLFARIATGDWDMVIVPHSSFGFIGISPEREKAYIEADVAALEEMVKEAAAEDQSDGWQKPPSVKEGERQLETLRERLKKVNDQKRDTLLTFEQLGVDDLTIDEAHEFKNLRYYTRLTKVLGLGNKQGSKKANDLFNKVRVLRESPTGSVTFMTGTPISNSVVEMYTMMRYLGMADLEDAGLEHFDAWHKQFAEAVTKFELNDANQLAEKTRLARWSNMPELMKLYYSFTDAVSLDDIKRWFSEDNGGAAFPVPKVKGGKRRNVIVEPTAAQQKILDEVVGEFNGLKEIKNPKERNAQRLRLMDRARKVSLDARAVDPYLATTEPGGKLERVSAEVARIYQQWTGDKGTQLVFLDRSVPKAKGDDKILAEYDRLKAEEAAALREGDEATFLELQDKLEKFDAGEMAALRTAQSGGWNAYEQIKANLVALGIPAGEIRFIQEANTDEQKQQLFEAVKAGEVRVLIGSTSRMGAGTNVQDRLVALHHVDVNWKPSDIEQREGRIIRQGNKLLEKYGMEAFEIEIMAYATERTYDAKMWALNEAKGRFINGLRAYAGEREVEIDDEESENMAEMAAMASGDPRMLERVQLDAEVKKLELMRRSHNRRQFAIQDQVADAEKLIARGPGAAEAAEADWATIVDADEKAEAERAARTVTVDGESFSKLFDAHQRAQALIAEMKGDNERARFQLEVNGELRTSVASVEVAINDALGDATPPGLVFNDGTAPTTRWAAGKLLAEEIAKLEGQPDKAVGVGHLRGIPVYLSLETSRWNGQTSAVLHAKGRYVDDAVTLTEVGANKLSMAGIRENLSKLHGKLGWYSGSARDLRERVKRAEADVGALREQAGKPFAKQAEYEAKQQRLADLTATLAAEADHGGAAAAPVPEAAPVAPAAEGDGLAKFSKPRREVVYTKDDFRVAIDISPTAEVARDVDFLREKIQELAAAAGVSADGATIEAVTVPDAAGGLVGVVKRLFNVDVRFVKADGLPADLAFDGIYVGRNVVYVNADSQQAYSAIIGHEFLHYLRHAAPDLYDDFVRQAARVIRLGPAGKAAAAEAGTYQRFGVADPLAIGWEEIYADLFADSWADPKFWEAMAGQDQSLTGKLLQLLRRFINRIKAMLIRERHTLLRDGLYKDFDAVRSVVLEATTRFAAEGYTPYQGLATTRFVTTPAEAGGLGGLAAAGVAAGKFDRGPARSPVVVKMQQQAPAAVALQVVDKILADGQLAAGRYRFTYDPTAQFKYIEVTTDGGGYVGAFAPDMAAGELVAMMNDEPGLLRDLREALQPGGPEDDGPGGGKLADSSGTIENMPNDPTASGQQNAPAPEADIGEAIEVDGVMRPTRNSRGKFIHPTKDGIRNFWRWFGNSKVVNYQGRPQVVYHGTNAEFTEFDIEADARGVGGWWFSDSYGYSNDYFGQGDESVVFEFYIKSENPKIIDIVEEANRIADERGEDRPADSQEAQHYLADEYGGRWDFAAEDYVSNAKANGNDGLIFTSFADGRVGDTSAYILWDSRSIKSAFDKKPISFDEFLNGRRLVERNGKFYADGKFETTHRRETLENEWRKEASIQQKFGNTGAFNGNNSDFRFSRRIDTGRPQVNSAGRPIHPTAEGVRNFWRWFGKSLVVDDGGRPQVMYHGTSRDFDAFDRMKSAAWRRVLTMDNIGSWFSDNPAKVDDYSGPEGRQTMPVYLRIERPKVYDSFAAFLKDMHAAAGTIYDARNAPGRVDPNPLRERLQAQGYDGVSFMRTETAENRERIGVQAERKRQAEAGYWAAEKVKDKAEMGYYRRIIDEADRIIKEAKHLVGEDPSTEFDDQYVWVAFEPGQIKSAIGNDGSFNGEVADIRFSRPRGERSVAGMAQVARQYLDDTFAGDTAKTFNWWHKTVGSQLHKAKIEPAFGRVYRGAQAFIDDVARYAAEAADRAPGVLPKMDTVAGALREVWHARRDAADTKAIAKPIFEGTLYEGENGERGKVWSDRELADDFGLNERQIGLYREFRRAVDHSLESMAIAEMNKVARVHELERPKFGMSMNALADFYAGQYADELAKLRAAYDDRLKVYEATEALMRQNAAKPGMKMSYQKYMETMNGLKAEFEAEHNQIRRQIEDLERLDKAFREKAATINQLQREGYAPLMRFGNYTVDVVQMVPAVDDEGNQIIDQETGEMQLAEERVFFSMFESEREAREAERILAEEYPQATVTRGVASEDGWQLFGGVHPGSLEALIELVGKEDEIVQRFYKEAVANRSALKRLIHRKGMAGYSEDVGRSLASFVLSNARAAAAADHFGDMVEAANDIPKEKGDVKDEAVRLINYVRNPNEEAGTLRGLLFMQYLGGSIAAAAVNLTQSVTTTMPYMAQFGSGPGELIKAGRLALARMRGKGEGIDADLAAALQRAEDEGVVAPHNIHALMGASGAQAMTKNRVVRMMSHLWGSFFGMAEQFNRETAFIMAFERAMDLGAQGMREAYDAAAKVAAGRGLPPPNRADFASPYAFAKNAVNETQFVLSKAARPNWARGTVGATLFTFKQFSVMYLELFKRLPNRERAIMLGTLIVLAGIGGAPGADDLDDLIDTLGQMLGYSTNSRKWKRDAAAAIFGEDAAVGDFVLHGVSAFLPLDVASRLGMGNLVPMSGALKKSNSGHHEKEIMELLGPAGGYFKQLTDAWDYTLQGRYGMAVTQAVAPKAIKDLAKGIDMAESGRYDDTHGRRVTDVTPLDALIKAIGFQPTTVSEVQRIKGEAMQDIGLAKLVKASIAEVWANAIHDGDEAAKATAREMLAEWNEKNPDAPISISPAAVLRRVQQMRLTAAERMVKTAPQELRAGVRAAFGE